MSVQRLQGDCRSVLPTLESESVQLCVTSPPYYQLRNYGVEGQIGLEPSVGAYVAELVQVFREVKRVLRSDGVLFLNLGDSFGKGKQLLGVPWRVAFALQDNGWILRSDIIWAKPNAMPESVTDRCTKSHEYIFMLSKNERYFYDAAAVAEPVLFGANGSTFTKGKTALDGARLNVGQGERSEAPTRNKRSVWTIPTSPYPGAHYATFPEALVETCLLAGTSPQACEHCSAPWKRVVERERFDRTGDRLYGGTLGHNPSGKVPGSNTRGMPSPTVQDIGWAPTCQCANTGSGRCVVLDPFFGSGTTAKVATKHGRDCIGIELNDEYEAQSNVRTNNVQISMESWLV